MSYQLVVTKIEPNPSFDPQRAAETVERSRRGGMQSWDSYDVPANLETRTLNVILDEVEYEAVKRAVIETWK